MNRCRRMASLAARRLVGAGWRVLVRDPLGSGDSSGDFGDASWQCWIDDLKALLDEAPRGEPVWLWGVRAGALLVSELAKDCPDANILLWQPTLSGRAVLTQFLRIRMASAALAGKERVDVKALRAQLSCGHPQEVAGYLISPSLADGLEQSVLALPETFRGRVVWLEVAAAESGTLSPSGDRLRQEWAARGLMVHAEAVAGELFWQTQEMTDCPSLLDATERLVNDNYGPRTMLSDGPMRLGNARESPSGHPASGLQQG